MRGNGNHKREGAGLSLIAHRLTALALLGLLASFAPAAAEDAAGPLDLETVDKLFPPVDPDAPQTTEPADPGAAQTTNGSGQETRPGADPLADLRKIEQQALETRTKEAADRYDALVKAANALLKQAETPAEPPPSLGASCNEQDDIVAMLTSELVQGYVKRAGKPEADLLTALLDARRSLNVLGQETTEGFELETALAERLMHKVEQVLNSTRKQRDKVLPVVAMANRVGQLIQLLGDSGLDQRLVAETGAWAAELIPSMLDDIAKKHDYSLVNAVFQVARAANSTGLDTGTADVDALMARIEALMQFDLTLTFNLTSTGANGLVEEWVLESRFPLRYKLGGGGKTLHAVLVGDGQGSYVSYVDKDPGSKLTMQGASFPVSAKIDDFDACLGNATVVIDQFYAETETYFTKNGPPTELPILQSAWIMMFEDRMAGGAYSFKVPLNNRTPIAIDRKIRVVMGVFDGTLTIKLKHKPT